ncbi:MAG TPA: phytanoyl-CoA dioxygenase family protein [Oculatellaceae cyanobacterium]|jgi:hypothetical protein
MLNHSQIEQFHKDGFLLVPSVFTQEQIGELREYLIKLFESDIQYHGDTGNFRLDICTRYPELRWLLTHPPMLSTLRSLLGDDFIYLPETAAHRSNYSTWHKDTTSQEYMGHTFQWQPNYLLIETAVYLQDNNEYGGGLDVIPGSHLYPDVRTNPNAHAFWQNISPQPSMYSIPGKAGDLVLFHFRVDHRASFPLNCAVENVPEEHRKYAMFFAASANNEHAWHYKNYIASRPDYHYLKNHQYPEELLQLAQEHNFILG